MSRWSHRSTRCDFRPGADPPSRLLIALRPHPRLGQRHLSRFSDRPALALLLAVGLAVRLCFIGTDLLANGDLRIFREWARLIDSQGLLEFYVHAPDIAYGPLSTYLIAIATGVRALVGGGDTALNALSRLAPSLADVATAGVLIWLLRDRALGLRLAVGAAYLFNPGPWYLSALWGQLDAVYALFAVLAVATIGQERVVSAWVATALAVLTKLQGLLILPLVLTMTWARQGWRAVLAGSAAAAALVCAFIAPWLLTGRLDEVIAAMTPHDSSVVVTGLNVWHLVLGGDPGTAATGDQPAGLPLSYLALSVGLYAAFVLAICLRVVSVRGAVAVAAPAGLLFLGMATLLAGVHERWFLAAVPLLLLAATGWPRSSIVPAYGVAYVILSATFFFNLLMVASPAPDLWTNLFAWRPPYPPLIALLKQLSFVAAAANVAVLAWISIRWLIRPEPGRDVGG